MHKDLLEQAQRLATLDLKKPKQANLRRAISAAYYCPGLEVAHNQPESVFVIIILIK